MVDSQFADSFANRLDIAQVTISQPIQTRRNQRASALVFQSLAPLAEGFGLLEFEHASECSL